MNTTAPTTIHPGIEAIFAAIDQLPDGQFLLLDEDDFGYADHGPVWTRPMTDLVIDLDTARADAQEQKAHLFANWFFPDGTRVPLDLRDDAWMHAEFHPIPHNVRTTSRAAYRTPGGYLYVCLGTWYADAETTIDGAPAFTFVAAQELLRRWEADRKAASDAFFERHAAEIEARRPAWADRVDVFSPDSDETEVYYESIVGEVRISRLDSVFPEWTEDLPRITVPREEEISTDEARKLAAYLIAAADKLEGAL
ncbi:hypothetical protein [Microbacterium lacticum]